MYVVIVHNKCMCMYKCYGKISTSYVRTTDISHLKMMYYVSTCTSHEIIMCISVGLH